MMPTSFSFSSLFELPSPDIMRPLSPKLRSFPEAMQRTTRQSPPSTHRQQTCAHLSQELCVGLRIRRRCLILLFAARTFRRLLAPCPAPPALGTAALARRRPFALLAAAAAGTAGGPVAVDPRYVPNFLVVEQGPRVGGRVVYLWKRKNVSRRCATRGTA